MAELNVGSYKAQTQKVYDVLTKAQVTNDAQLQRLDKNGDMIISEDELVEFCDTGEDNNAQNAASGTSSTESQIVQYEKMIADLYSQLAKLSSRMGTAKDAETLKSITQEQQNILSQIKTMRQNIFNCLYQQETKEANEAAKALSSSMNSATGTQGANNVSYNTGNYNISPAVGNTSSNTANYALQFDGKNAAEMKAIMQQAGCRFDDGLWCADFATFAAKMGNGGNAPHNFLQTCPNTAGCTSIGNWAVQNGLYTTDVSRVRPGDFVLYGSRGSEYHIGIVTSVNPDGSVNTVEGNTSDDNGNYTNGVVNQHHNVKRYGGFVLMH